MAECLFCKTILIQKLRGRNKKYCNRSCCEKAKHQRNYIPKVYDPEKRKRFIKTCIECSCSFETKSNHQKVCNKRKCKVAYQNKNWQSKNKFEKECPICKGLFKTAYNHQITCSINCQGKRQTLVYCELNQDSFMRNHSRVEFKRRQRIKSAWIEDVDIKVLIERDQGICQLCFNPVDLEVHPNHNHAPSKDHIIPIVHGGEHSYNNTQLAHRICNSKKGDSIDVVRKSETIC